MSTVSIAWYEEWMCGHSKPNCCFMSLCACVCLLVVMLHDVYVLSVAVLVLFSFDRVKGALIIVPLLDSFASFSGCLWLFTVHVVLLYSLVVMFHLFVVIYEGM